MTYVVCRLQILLDNACRVLSYDPISPSNKLANNNLLQIGKGWPKKIYVDANGELSDFKIFFSCLYTKIIVIQGHPFCTKRIKSEKMRKNVEWSTCFLLKYLNYLCSVFLVV